jgi:REP element-mobilizing transposase RayT
MKRDYIEFQERSVPKAFFITFRTFGTWFHGDERGSVDRRSKNKYGTPRIQSSSQLVWAESVQTDRPSFKLQGKERIVVDFAIRNLCVSRNYHLHALNVRTNHVHLVVGNSGNVERTMNAFKAFATKDLRSKGLIANDFKPWSRHGSTRYLWTDEHISAAVDYVVNGQGDDLIEFDRDKR